MSNKKKSNILFTKYFLDDLCFSEAFFTVVDVHLQRVSDFCDGNKTHFLQFLCLVRANEGLFVFFRGVRITTVRAVSFAILFVDTLVPVDALALKASSGTLVPEASSGALALEASSDALASVFPGVPDLLVFLVAQQLRLLHLVERV